MVNPIPESVDRVRKALDDVDVDNPLTAVEQLARAQAALTTALDEAMALAVLAGESMRTVGSAAGMAPNSVPPRLARSSALSPYTDSDRDRVTLEDVARARHDYRTAAAPLRFTPRKPTRKADPDD